MHSKRRICISRNDHSFTIEQPPKSRKGSVDEGVSVKQHLCEKSGLLDVYLYSTVARNGSLCVGSGHRWG